MARFNKGNLKSGSKQRDRCSKKCQSPSGQNKALPANGIS